MAALSSDSHAANAGLSREHLSRIWNEQFSPTVELPKTQTGPLAPPPLVHSQLQSSTQPHPAVARIIVPEGGATSYGSGTLVDIRDQFGLVITNWHVVRDAKGDIEVAFPNGFQSKARALKVDADWDLAALVVWQPKIEPVKIAKVAPQPGDQLTICGYGQGMYRAATGRCTQYYAPRLDFPRHMVELDVEARQGDSGGPIFNSHGELAGVLFGAGQGTTLGSFGGRVESFLATLAPAIGKSSIAMSHDEAPPAIASKVQASDPFLQAELHTDESMPVKLEPRSSGAVFSEQTSPKTQQPASDLRTAETSQADSEWQSAESKHKGEWPQPISINPPQITRKQSQQLSDTQIENLQSVPRSNLFEQIKTGLAVIGVMALAALMLRAAR